MIDVVADVVSMAMNCNNDVHLIKLAALALDARCSSTRLCYDVVRDLKRQ